MLVLLVNPPMQNPGRIAKKVHPPLNLLYLATSLKAHGIAVKILDGCAADLTFDQLVARIAASKAGLIGFPLFSDIIKETHSLVRATRVKLPNTPIVLGGIHVTADTPGTTEIFSEANYFLAGYAEKSLPILVRAIENNTDFDNVPRLTYRTESGIQVSQNTDDLFNIHDYPIPDRSFVKEHYNQGDYYQILTTRPLDSIVTSRGCRYSCKFCYNAVRGGVHHRGAENIYEEIYARYQAGIRFIDVDDDNFTQDRERAMTIFSWIIKDKLDLILFLKARPDSVNEEFLKKAYQAGVRIISYGIESGAQFMLDAMSKGTLVDQNARVIAMTKSAGIMVHVGHVIGFPGETPQTISKTIDFVRAAKPFAISATVLKPYPGTAIFEEAKATGTLIGSWNPAEPGMPWVKLSWTRSYQDLLKWHRRFIMKTYLRPGYAAGYFYQIGRNANMRLARYLLESLWNLGAPA